MKDACDSYNTPLHLAAREGHVEMVKYLVEHGAYIPAKDGLAGNIPLQDAKREDVKEYLKEKNGR